MVKTRSQDGDSKGKELDVEDLMESRLSRLEDLFAERNKMMKLFVDSVKALAGQQLEELQSSNVLLEEKSKPQFQVISDPFIEPLECASNLKVPASVYDMDSHVKEMEEFPHQSTNGSGKKIAHQLFDQMPSKEKQRKCLKAWKFKFKTTSRRSKSMDVKFFSVEEFAWLTKDSKEINQGCVNKEFKEAMAGCGKKIFDRFKIVDETSKPAVYDGTIQIRVWDCGGSLLECVWWRRLKHYQCHGREMQALEAENKSSGDVKFHLKHKWRFRVLQTLSGLEFCLLPAKLDFQDWPKGESKPHRKKSHQIGTFEVLSSLEPSRRSHSEQLGVSEDFPFAIVRTHISQSQSDLKCVTGNTHRMFDVMPLETKPLKDERKKALQKTWWFKFKTSLEGSKLDDKLSFMEESIEKDITELGAQQGFKIEVWSSFDLEACIGFITYGWEFKKQINQGQICLNGLCNELDCVVEKKKLRNVEDGVKQDKNRSFGDIKAKILMALEELHLLQDLFEMVKELLLKTSLVIQQVMRSKKIKFPKRWMFKYKDVDEGIKRLQAQLSYKCRWKLEEWFKIWNRRESGRKHKLDQRFMIATKEEMWEDMKVNDQKQQGDCGHYSLLVAAANWSSQMHLWSSSYQVWHRWKARCFYVGMISTMRAWLFGEGGFDIGKGCDEVKTRGRDILEAGINGSDLLELKTVKKMR